MDYEAAMGRARQNVEEMDRVDKESGSATPQEMGSITLLRTAMEAITCGVKCDDFETVAEGQVLLEKLHRQQTGEDFRPLS